MRLSRPRLVLRAVLLLGGAAFMLERAWQTGRAGLAAGGGDDARLQVTLAAVEALMGLLALAAAALAVLALRQRPRRHSLHLPP